jgi:hypothetical protein
MEKLELDMQLTQPTTTSCGAGCAVDSTSSFLLDDQGAGRGVGGNGQFRQPAKQQTARFRCPPVDPERELVEIILKMVRADIALQGPEYPSFQQTDDQMAFRQDDIRQFPVVLGRDLAPVSQPGDAVVTAPSVRPDERSQHFMRLLLVLLVATALTRSAVAAPAIEATPAQLSITAPGYRLQFQGGGSFIVLELRDAKGEWRRVTKCDNVTKRDTQPEFAVVENNQVQAMTGLNAQLRHERIHDAMAVGLTTVLTAESARVLKVHFLCADEGLLIRSELNGAPTTWWPLPRMALDETLFSRYAFWSAPDEFRAGLISDLGTHEAYAGVSAWGQRGDTAAQLSERHPAIVACSPGAGTGLGLVLMRRTEEWRGTASFIQRHVPAQLFFYPAVSRAAAGWAWLAPFVETEPVAMAARVERLLVRGEELVRDFKPLAPEPERTRLEPVPDFPREQRRAKPIEDLRDAAVFTVNESIESDYGIRAARKAGSDVLIRGWFKWHSSLNVSPLAPFVREAHAIGARFGGAISCSALSHGENGLTETQVLDMATRAPDGGLVDVAGVRGLRHGTLSNPAFLDRLLRWCREQIDAGADYLFMDEINAGLGSNEGFDDYSLKDFRDYLTRNTARLPEALRKEIGDMAVFDYRIWLKERGAKDSLAGEWQRFRIERDDLAWKRLTDTIRAYAASKGRRVWISANGLARYVDLQVLGVWNEWRVRDRAVDLGESQLEQWAATVSAGWARAGRQVPVVFFHDWGFGGFPWMEVAPFERELWMRVRGAEIYAAGGFFAFPVLGPFGNDALRDGTIREIARQTAFYQRHRDLYLRAELAGFEPLVSDAPNLSLALWKRAEPPALLLHVVNRQAENARLTPRDVSVRLPLDTQPKHVTLVSPDWSGERTAESKLADGELAVNLPQLEAYTVAILDYDRLPSVQLSNRKIVPQTVWGLPERNEFVLQSNGSVIDQWALTTPLQGNLHAELRDPPTFRVHMPRGGTLRVHVGAVASLGAKLEFSVDGVLAQTVDLPDLDGKNDFVAREYDRTFEFAIPSGRHRVTLRNGGGDWAYVRSYAFVGEITE